MPVLLEGETGTGKSLAAAVHAWLAGQPNHGWALSLGDDELILESFEGTDLGPELVIDDTLP